MNRIAERLESLLAHKRREWSAALLENNPRLQLPLQNALTLVYQQRVSGMTEPNLYRVRGNPHDYFVNLASRTCSCGKPMCEHLLAAWFAYSQAELVRQEMEQYSTNPLEDSHVEHGRWHGKSSHTCADGYHETAVFGCGDDTRCARCEAAYCPLCDDSQ